MKKYTQETVVGIFVVVGLFAIAYMTVKLGNVGFLGDDLSHQWSLASIPVSSASKYADHPVS